MIPKEGPLEVDSRPKGDDKLMGPNVGLSQEFQKIKLVYRG